MEPAEGLSATIAPAPVFVDDTGRRRVLTRRAGRILVIGFAGYIGLMVVGLAGDPRVGRIHLPTFGLPNLGPVAPPAASVLGEHTSRSDSDADVEVATSGAPAGPPDAADRPGRPESSRRGPEVAAVGTNAGRPDPSTSASGGASPPGEQLVSVGSPAGTATPTTWPTTTTTSRNSGNGPKSSTTTSSTTTMPTTSTSEPGPGSGQGSGQSTGPVSAKGPDGTGAPGQQRKTTTTTAG